MKHINEYNKFNKKDEIFEVGDYIVAEYNRFLGKLKDFMSGTTVKIASIKEGFYYVEYDQFDFDIYNNYFGFEKNEIRHATPKEIEDHQLKIATNKYNI